MRGGEDDEKRRYPEGVKELSLTPSCPVSSLKLCDRRLPWFPISPSGRSRDGLAPEWTRVVGCWMKDKKSSGSEEVEKVWFPGTGVGAGAGEYGWVVGRGLEVTLVWERREEVGLIGREGG